MTKVFLIHGSHGSPEENWFPWLKQELEKAGLEVIVPELLDSSSTAEQKLPVERISVDMPDHSAIKQQVNEYLDKCDGQVEAVYNKDEKKMIIQCVGKDCEKQE